VLCAVWIRARWRVYALSNHKHTISHTCIHTYTLAYRLETHHPLLYTRLKQKVAAQQFFPEGGSWVEMDCNIPSGEVCASIHEHVFMAVIECVCIYVCEHP
jgi:alpha-mannosidase